MTRMVPPKPGWFDNPIELAVKEGNADMSRLQSARVATSGIPLAVTNTQGSCSYSLSWVRAWKMASFSMTSKYLAVHLLPGVPPVIADTMQRTSARWYHQQISVVQQQAGLWRFPPAI